MGGSDFYCSVSGAHYGIGSVADSIIEDACEAEADQDSDPEEEYANEAVNSSKFSIQSMVDRLRLGLRYKSEDFEAARDLVLISPYIRTEDGTVTLHCDFEDPHPEEHSDATITEVFNIVPGQNPELGDYKSIDRSDTNRYCVIGYGTTLIIAYTSYLILRQAAPSVRPWMVYSLAKANEGTQGHIPGVDYGPVGAIAQQYAWYSAICKAGPDDDTETGEFWYKLFTQKGKTEKEILHDAWYGPGNMWVFVRPDRFPIADALAADVLPTFTFEEPLTLSGSPPILYSLPPDVLINLSEFLPVRSIYALIGACKRFRAHILPHANALAYRGLLAHEPWYLPAGPFKIPGKLIFRTRGREDVDYWEREWAKAGFASKEVQAGLERFHGLLTGKPAARA